MKSGHPSRTAEYMAFFRACESLRPESGRLFDDPFATHFLRLSLRAAAWASKVPILAAFIRRYADHRLPGARTSAIARTRLIDDAVCHSLRSNIPQLVILGAGFDCRAYRLPGIHSASVFEVDHPATLASKLDRLRRVLPKLPGHVQFVPIDFNHQQLPHLLRQGGFDSSLPALFLWEGVTNYLSAAAVDSVLRFVSSCAPRSQIIFTFVHSGLLNGSVHFDGGEKLLQDVAQLSEPWTFGLDPRQLPDFLRQRGLQLDFDSAARDYRAYVFGTESSRMSGYDFYHVALAHVFQQGSQHGASEQNLTPRSSHAQS
jgi:methyltransferase (TIGR00027 family)